MLRLPPLDRPGVEPPISAAEAEATRRRILDWAKAEGREADFRMNRHDIMTIHADGTFTIATET